jgi:hypothetical protein
VFHDPRIVAAVRLIISDVQRSVAPAIAEARFFQCLDQVIEEREARTAERYRKENAEALREMAALGNARGAALKVAQRRSKDPSVQHRLAQRFRRLLREKK